MIYVDILTCIVILWAGISDFKTRTVKDRYTVFILILALIKVVVYDASIAESILGGIVVFVPFLAVAMKKGGIGGADIKLTTALGIYLGWSIYPVVILSYLALMIFALLYRLAKKQKLMHIPYICFLTVGLYCCYIFKLFS